MLHYPKGEPRLYAWEHIKWVELTTKIKYPDKYLESLIKDKEESLNWLLDQRTKDLIRKELEKIAKVEKANGNNSRQDAEIEKLINRIRELRALIYLFYDEIAKHFNAPDLQEYLNGLIEKGDAQKLKEFISYVEKLARLN